MLNTDAWASGARRRTSRISGTAKLDLLDMLIAEGKQQGRYFTPDPHPRPAASTAPTISPSPRSGVPAISFAPGNDLVNGGIARGEALATEYTDKHYHQPSDELIPSWDFTRHGRRTPICSTTSVGERLANSRDWPNWSADSEFRAARDQSAAERQRARRPPRRPAPQEG